jgi:putative oxidoreductase
MVSLGLLVLRLALAVVFFAHGANILFGSWSGPGIGGGGLTATAAYYVSLGLEPGWALALLSGSVQLIGSVLLGFGFLTRWAGMALAGFVAVGVWKEHLKWGFFLNWTFAPNQHHGIEYSLLLASVLLAFILGGAGDWSIDGYRQNRAASRAAGRARLRGKV